jgi:hypothetical protein
MKPQATKKTIKKLPYVIIRGYRAGVHAGELVSYTDGIVTLTNARRIWYWNGAASLSELAVYGASKPSECRFGASVAKHAIVGNDACEIIYCQPAGERMIRNQPEWRA